jgi:NAD(P) transhydrogenase subunit alpha
MMKIGVPKEVREGETRVALIPQTVMELKKMEFEILIEKGAGEKALFSDEAYKKAGATIVDDAKKLYQEADIVLKVQPPQKHPKAKKHELELMKEGSTLVGFLSPWTNRDLVEQMQARKITAFAMELIPRITRAQSMDALSSMATVAGYKAVLIAADTVQKFFPLLMTAAGTIPPANVLVIGAGVAGLQAIATAKRLGARVEAFDVRPSVKEQIESLGAKFIEMELPEDVETKDGYAKEVSEDFIRRELEAIGSRLPRMDVVISTAQVFGKKAPVLITEEMVKTMKPGSVIVDLAAEQGGNCELTEAGKVVTKHGVTIYGPVNLPAQLPVDASQMYARNITNFVKHIFQAENRTLDFEDEITKNACVCHNGEIVSETIKSLFGGSSS